MLQRILLISSTFIVLSSLCPTILHAAPHHKERAVTRERVRALDRSLAEARLTGHLPPRVHVYADSLAERPYYDEVIRKYYPNPNALIYDVVPPVYAPAYVERLKVGAVEEFIFWGNLPPSYPPFWEPIWDPFFERYHRWGIHGDYRPHHHGHGRLPHGIHPHHDIHRGAHVRHHAARHRTPHRSAAVTHPSHVRTHPHRTASHHRAAAPHHAVRGGAAHHAGNHRR